jgi:tetratricopeptide (TPR) repeat protein
MAATTAKSLSALLAQTSIDDHDEVLKAANAAVKKSKADLDAHHTKAIALLHLDRYEDALEVFEHTSALQEKASFEYAYALYKTGNAAKAVEVAGAAQSKTDRGTKHMLAQAVRAEGASWVGEGKTKAANVRRHIAQKTSPKPQKYTRSSPTSPSTTRNTIFASTPELSTPSWNGRAKASWPRRRSLLERTWKSSRQPSTRRVEA